MLPWRRVETEARTHPDRRVHRQWGAGDENFASDPPNVVLSLFEDEHLDVVVVVLSDPVLSAGDLSCAVEVTDGDIAPSTGPVSLFIGRTGRSMTPRSAHALTRRG